VSEQKQCDGARATFWKLRDLAKRSFARPLQAAVLSRIPELDAQRG